MTPAEAEQMLAFTRGRLTAGEALAQRGIPGDDRERMLRSMRRLMAEHSPLRNEGRTMCSTCLGSCTFWPCPTQRILAATWDDHPEYREKWRP